jgi:hypothetical protein
MIPHFKIQLLTITVLLFSLVTYGQQRDTATGKQVLTVAQIDSICKTIDSNKRLIEGIAEGGFYNQKGGWETYDLKSKDGDTLFRIRHNSSTDLYHKTTFYYFYKQLIKSSIEIEDWNSGTKMKLLYAATYYFSNGKPIKVINENKTYSTASEMINLGINHQNNFYHNQ